MNEIYPGEAALRRALHAAAEQVDPGGDGLDRIRERVRHRRPMPLPIAWVDIALTRLSLRVPDGFWAAWDRVAHEARSVAQHFLPAPARDHAARSGRTWLGWARPLAAMSTGIFIVAAVVYMAVEVPQVISTAGSAQRSVRTSGPHQPAGGNTGPGGQADTKAVPSQSIFPAPTAGATNSTTCAKTKPASPKTITVPPSPSPSTTPPTSPTPTPSPSPSTSASPTPTPSDTDTSPATGSGTSPSAGSLAPADPGSGTTSYQANTASNTTEHGGSKPQTAIASPTPCPSRTPSTPSTPSIRVSPVGAGPLTLWTGGAALTPADERARIS
jgi:hypothetical protein